MKNKSATKKRLNIGLSLALVAVLVIGVTLALLSQRTNSEVNNFTVLGGLDVILDEEWDPNEGKNITPNVPIQKEPHMINESDSTTAYVAMKITLVEGNAADADSVNAADYLSGQDYEKLLDLIEIRFDASATTTPDLNPKWELISTNDLKVNNGAVYMYADVVGTGGQTEDIFKTVTLKKDATSAEIEWIKDTLDGFDIFLEGAAVQADDTNVTKTIAEAELLTLLGDN